MSPNILGIVAKHSIGCRQTFRGTCSNILGNVAKHSEECPQTFWGMSLNIAESIFKQSDEYFFANASLLYTFFTGSKETDKQKCSELSATWSEINIPQIISVGLVIL